jgi:APA family basic amino acid/polyamine antiporter
MAVRAEKPLLSRWKREPGDSAASQRQISYTRILVPLGTAREVAHAMAVACRLAADRRAMLTALNVIEIPAELPLAAQMPEEEAQAHARASEARAIAELYGVSLTLRLRRARSAGEAIVEEAAETGSEIVVISASRRVSGRSRREPIFGRTVDYVLKHAPCRTFVAALPRGE